MIGTTLGGRYAILRQIGQGGMGAVYEARHTGTNRRVAVKVITADINRNPVLIARFEIEAKAAGTIESQHITQVLDVGRDEAKDVPFMVMEYLSGEDILHLIQRLGQVPPHLAVRIVAQTCIGLEKAHKANIIHRDIKAANLFLVERDMGEHVVKILDFGIAKVKMPDDDANAAGGVTKTGSLIGSPLYMSPEQARGSQELEPRSDIWSLGIVLYQLLTGRTPFQGVEALGELIIRICSEPVPSVQTAAPWVAPEIAQIVAKALTIDANQRYRSAEEMFIALRALLPNGFSIDASMLVPLGKAERAIMAPVVTGTAARASAPSVPQFGAIGLTPVGLSMEGGSAAGAGGRPSVIPASGLGPMGMSTGAGMTLSPKRRGRSPVVALAGVLGVGVLLVGAFLALRGGREKPVTPVAEPTAVAAAVVGAAGSGPASAVGSALRSTPASTMEPPVAAPSTSASTGVQEQSKAGGKPPTRPVSGSKKTGKSKDPVGSLLGQD